MESAKNRIWDWRAKVRLGAAAFALAAFFIGPWAVAGIDYVLGNAAAAAPDVAAIQAAQKQQARQQR